MKEKSKFVCSACGYSTTKWLGKCPECNGWSTFVEEVVRESKATKVPKGNTLTPKKLESESGQFNRIQTGISEVDLVFGEGVVEGSITLLSGEPGIGKSTLTLQICDAFIKQDRKVLYVAGEESVSQIANRAKRIGVRLDMDVVNETCLEDVLETARQMQPHLLVVDSIQVIYSDAIQGIPGSVTQVRFATEKLMELAKSEGITVLLIGHVTKDGTLAGPRVLEHLVDVVLYIEGERYQNLRLLKTFKNRFGATDEVGVFEMTSKGLAEVKNPSSIFLEEGENKIGSVITSIIEGTRPFFIEVQALCTYTKFGYPKRTISGVDLNRVNIILAVLGKYAGVNLDNYDVYVSTVGGFQAKDPGIDLAIALAIVSSKLQKEISSKTLALGEIGLTGSIRPVMQMEKRIKEAKKLGIEQIIVSGGKEKKENIITVKNIKDAIDVVFK
jgi:DNA repair protein RadA/Sms